MHFSLSNIKFYSRLKNKVEESWNHFKDLYVKYYQIAEIPYAYTYVSSFCTNEVITLCFGAKYKISVFWLFLCWETLANDCSSACTILNMVCLIIWTKTYVNIELKQICMCYIPPKAKYTCMRGKWQYSNLFLKLL